MNTSDLLKEKYTKLSQHEKQLSATFMLWATYLATNEEPTKEQIDTVISISSVMGVKWSDVTVFYKSMNLAECLEDVQKVDSENIVTMILNILLITVNKLDQEKNAKDIFTTILNPLSVIADKYLNEILDEFNELKE